MMRSTGVGVWFTADTRPWSMHEIRDKMGTLEDNFNLVRKERT